PFTLSAGSGSAGPAGKWMVSSGAGITIPTGQAATKLKWRGDGRELFYLERGNMMAVSLSALEGQPRSIKPGVPKALFKFPARASSWDVTPDGNRFLIAMRAQENPGPPAPLTVVVNWTAGLRK